ncbi:MAG: alanine acetyltransferase [Frankiales bacterium]|nr:alanine acetyltransferase [Frankiales bacterium]
MIERFRWWHIDEVLPIEQDLFPPEPWSAGQFWTELGQTETRHYVVALDADRVVGYAGLCDYPDEAFVQTMAVARDQQGKGIGVALLEDLLAEAGRRRHTRVLLEVRVDNEPAQRLYARYGFRKESVRKAYYPGGIDALVMVRTT